MTLLPVSAVCCVSADVLLIAQGSHLILSRDSSISTLSLLSPGTIIHGIKPCSDLGDNLNIVFGQKEFQIVRISSELEPIYYKPIELQDWIIACHSFSDFIFILTIHNQCSKIRISDGIILHSISPLIKCILYSATFHGHNIDTFKIASGTGTNKIIVWRPFQTESELISLNGHDGVIFSVEFNTIGTKLVSVSDDRTVRVWELSGATLLTATLYGHTSRVWSAIFVPCTNDTFVLSIGEDSTLRLWSVERCENIHTFIGHKGKSVWSVTISPDGRYAYTGGNDCSLRKWNLTPYIKHDKNTKSMNIELTNETPRIVHILSSCSSVVFTSAGSLWEIQMHTGATNLVYKNALFSSYSVTALTLSKDTIAIGGLKGHLLLLNVANWNVIYFDKICEGKILNLNWCDQFLIISALLGSCIFTQLSAEHELMKLHVLTLPYSSHRWVTSFIIIKEQLILGDGKGSLHLYTNFSDIDPIFSLFKIHGPNPVTSLQQIGEFIYSTGRDGKLRLILIKDGKLILKNSIQVVKNCSWLERIYISSSSLILALAFHGNEILLVNVSNDTIVVSITCGGGHRSWDTNSFEDILNTGKLFISYIKCHETMLVTRDIEGISDHPLSVPFLGREGLCVSILDTLVDGTIVLAAGDGIGTLSIVLSLKSGFKIVSTNQCHVGNINAIEVCFVNNNLFMFTAGGRGLLKVWEVNKDCLQSPNNIFEFYLFVCEVSAKPIFKRKSKKMIGQSEIDDFRITTICLLSLPHSKCVIFCCCSDGFIRVYLFTSDTLLTPLTCIEHTNRCLLSSCLLYTHNLTPILLTAATDGEIVFWEISKIFQNLDTFLVTDFIPSLLTKITTITCHLSGVNSICIAYNSVPEIATLVSVGDDTSICVTKMNLFSEEISIARQRANLTEHTSSIVKTEIIEFEETSFVVTLSRDQRLKLFVLNNMELILELKETRLLDVKSISGMKCERRGGELRVFIVGEGLQTIDLIL